MKVKGNMQTNTQEITTINGKEAFMRRTWLIATVMAVGLGVYGYLLSSAGHDHAAHGGSGHHHAESSAEETQHH